MNYISTRTVDGEKRSAAYVIKKGLAEDGGLYIPENIPTLDEVAVTALCGMSYTERAAYTFAFPYRLQ